MSQSQWAKLRTASDGWFESREQQSIDAEFRAIRSDVHSRRRKRRRGALVVGALLASIAAAGLFFVSQRKNETLIAKVEGRMLDVSQSWGNENERTSVTFSDGSEVQTEKQGRARVVSLHPYGAEVRLERGSLHAHVVHRDATRWSVLAGDFAIRVTGTSFDAAWDPEAQRVQVKMFEGRVVVFGPCLPSSGVALVAGESQEWSCVPKGLAVQKTSSPVVPPSDTASAPSIVPMPTVSASSIVLTDKPEPTHAPLVATEIPSAYALQEADASTPIATVEPTWRELAKARQYAEAWRRAKSVQASDHATAPELVELAEVARLAGDAASAVRLYRSVVDQFAGTPEAARAAFQLGRLSSGADAYSWFTRYLQAEPSGTFAQEALGRLIDLSVARGDRATAKVHASNYLARFPAGAHADYARSVISP